MDSIIELSERHGSYKNDEETTYWTRDKIHEIGLSEKLEFIGRNVYLYYMRGFIMQLLWMRDAHYQISGRAKGFELHSDASLVTGSIKLNDDILG